MVQKEGGIDMRPKASECKRQIQLELGQVCLDSFINMSNVLVRLGNVINWTAMEKKFGRSFHESTGRPGLPTRLMVGLTYLKHLHNLSDENVVDQLLHNPYWQYFCGFVCFQRERSLEPSSLTRFRERLGEEGAMELLKETIEVAKRTGLLKKSALKKVIADTTTQEKNISYPTDAKLINRAREGLVKEAKRGDILLRQSYSFVGKKESAQSARYFHAKQHKRGKASIRRQRNWLGRVIRDIKRKCPEGELSHRMREALKLGQRIFKQRRDSKNKIYSFHEPYVECLSKGKAHRLYEFGNKVSFTVTWKDNWIVGAKSFFGNPFDGKTLKGAIRQTERLTGCKVKKIAVDRGYRGKKFHPKHCKTFLSGGGRGNPAVRRFLRRRSSIEPVIGHMKQDHRLGRNYLKGLEGDKFNPILSACAFNLRKTLKAFIFSFFNFVKILQNLLFLTFFANQ